MARRRKHRTHKKAEDPSPEDGTPKSFIIKHGQVGSSLTQLVRDMRKVMEPNTASRLRERTRNKLKDYMTMAPALHVTHLLAFTLTDIAPSLHIVRLPAGPTFSFRIERYSLVKDILKSSRRSKSVGLEYLSPPLLVLSSFPPPSPTTPPHLPLMMKAFQTLFPPLSPQTISLSSARRVVLIAYNAERGTVDFRHFRIGVRAAGVSRRVRRIVEPTKSSKSSAKMAAASAETASAGMSRKNFINLGMEKDIADFVLGTGGYETASSAESEVDEAGEVALAGDYVGRNNKKGSKRAVRLDEIGPRMELRLIKISEGVPGKEGEVMFHEFVHKTKKEISSLKATHAEKERLRKERREEQERNVAKKKADKEKMGKNADSDDESMGMHDDEEDDSVQEDDNDDAWDDEEDASEGGEDDDDESLAEESEESEDEEALETKPPPTKKVKFQRKR